MPTIFIKDSLRAAVEAATGGQQTVLYNEQGHPGYYFVLPKFRYEELGYDGNLGTGVCTAFTVGGVEVSEVFIGAYQAVVKDSCALPIPGLDPETSIDWDEAKAACEANGAGFHMMTVHEWAAVALWCIANGFQPRGNTDYGSAHDAAYEVGRRQDGGIPGNSSGTARILAGSGPAAWRHNNNFSGIADLVGNIWEWQGLMKIDAGQIIVATDNDYSQAEGDWTAQDAYFANPSGTLTLQDTETAGDTTAVDDVDWDDGTNFTSSVASQLLKRILVEPFSTDYLQGNIWVNNADIRFPRRGGNWSDPGEAGLGALRLDGERSVSSPGLGARPAFISS